MAIPGCLVPPLPPGQIEGNFPVFVSGLLNAADEGAGNICQAPVDGVIAAIWVAWRLVNTGSTMEGRLESVDLTTGLPSGALVAAGADGTLVVNNADDNVCARIPLTTPPTVVAGDYLAPLVKQPTVGFGSLNIAQGTSPAAQTRMPYGVADTGAGYTPFATNAPNLMALEYDTGVIYGIEGVHPPASAITSTALSTSTTPDVIGMRAVFGDTVLVNGGWIWMDLEGDANLRLVTDAYNQGAGTGILASVALSAPVRNATTPGLWRVSFPDVTLTAGTPYRWVIEPTTTTSLTAYDFTTDSLALMNAWGGDDGAQLCFTSAKDPTGSGSWTDFNTGTFRHFYGGLRVRGVTAGSGGGGGGAFTFVG